MSPRRILPIARQNARLLLGNPAPVVVFFFTPILVMAIMKPTFKRVLISEGYRHANGSEQVVPGFLVFFVFFWMVFIGRTFFEEHGWGTWQRLQTSEATSADILVGKVLPAFLVILLQMILLFAIGSLIFGLSSAASVVPLLLVAVPLAACVVALTVAVVGLLKLMVQLDAAGNLLVMIFASLGGGLAPVAQLPAWARWISPAVPSHWATQAATDVILKGDGVATVLGCAGVVALFALGFTALAAVTFRVSASKVAT